MPSIVALEYRASPTTASSVLRESDRGENQMAKYLFQASYTAEGAKGLAKDGGSKRRQVAKTLVESVGGQLEAFYFAFGSTDVYAIVDMPDNASAAAVSVAAAASGAVSGNIVVLLTPEEMDQAVKKSADYTPPGR